MDQWFAYILVGLGCGVFSAMFGVGSGIILVPILVLLYQFPQKSAQGTCLAAMVPMVLAGALRYKFNPEIPVDMKVALWLAIGGVGGAVLGAAIAGALPGHVLRKLFAVVLIIAAVRMLLASPPSKGATPASGAPLVEQQAVQAEDAPGFEKKEEAPPS